MDAVRRLGLLNESPVVIDDGVVPDGPPARVLHVAHVIHAMPVVDPSPAIAVLQRIPELVAPDLLQHRVDLVPRVLVVEQMRSNNGGDRLLLAAEVDLAAL